MRLITRGPFWHKLTAGTAALLVGIAAALLIGAGVVFILTLRSPKPLGTHVLANTNGRAVHPIPVCSSAGGSVSTTVTIGINSAGNDFDQSCYYASANQQLSLVFTNSVFTLASHTPLPMTLVISAADDPAVASVPGNPMLSTVDTSKAVFISPTVTAPDTGDFTVPSLPAGTYALQVTELAYFVATLVIE